MVFVCVVGCGTLGLKVAGALCYFGHTVRVYDRDRTALDGAHERLHQDRRQLRRDGLLHSATFAGRLILLSHLDEAVQGAKLVFECVVEDVAIKRHVFGKLSSLCDDDTILATCTMQVPIESLAEKVIRPERVMGVRFLYPVYYIPEVEVSLGDATSKDTLTSVSDFLVNMGMTPFLRSGCEPLVLSEEQREQRKQWRRQRLMAVIGAGDVVKQYTPELAFVGNVVPASDQPAGRGAANHDCAVCMDAARDCVMSPCHHLCSCCRCARLLRNRRDGCPICRQPIHDFIRVYMS